MLINYVVCSFLVPSNTGVAFRQLAGSLFVDLVNELREYNNPNMPVLIAVDEYNNWEVPSAYSYNNQRVHAKQLCVPHSLNFLSLTKHGSDHWSLKNGMAIGMFVCAILYVFLCCVRFSQS